ncbi:MAG: metal ABC transporter permease [Thermoanaerobaculia bacterium]
MSWASWPAALAVALLAGVSCATLGVYVVHRRMAFIGDAIAHTMLPGIVVAAALGWSLSAGGLAAGLMTALGVGWLASRGGLKEDTAIGVLFTAMFALGLALASGEEAHEHLEQALFGSLRAVDGGDVLLLAVITALALAVLILFHKELELASCDPSYAEVIGIRTDALRYLLLLILTLVIVAGVQAVGVLLTAALLVTPAAAASLLTRRLPHAMAAATLIAALCSVVGLLVSARLDILPGAAVVLACTAAFGLAWGVRALRLRS